MKILIGLLLLGSICFAQELTLEQQVSALDKQLTIVDARLNMLEIAFAKCRLDLYYVGDFAFGNCPRGTLAGQYRETGFAPNTIVWLSCYYYKFDCK